MMQSTQSPFFSYTVVKQNHNISPSNASFTPSASRGTTSIQPLRPTTVPSSPLHPPMHPQSPSSSSRSSPTSPLPLKRPNSTATDTTTASTLPSDDSTGRRRRKVTKTRIFEITTAPSQPRRFSTGALGIQGRGEKLTNIPNISYAIEKCNAKDPQLEFLHRVLFNSAGQAKKRKSSIRVFSGFMFQSMKEKARVRDKILRANLHMVKKLTYILDLDMLDSKEATADAVLAFLENPKVLEGKGNRAERERLQKAEKKRAEKARAKKRKEEEQKKKEEELKKMRNGLNNKSDSDEDGDEDLEFEAKPWIVIAAEREAQRTTSNSQQNGEVQSSDDEGMDSGSGSELEQDIEKRHILEPKPKLDEERRKRAESILLGGEGDEMDTDME